MNTTILIAACNFKNYSIISQCGQYNEDGTFVDMDINAIDSNIIASVKVSNCNGYLFTQNVRIGAIQRSFFNAADCDGVLPLFVQR